mgnify:CR=1 FL=1
MRSLARWTADEDADLKRMYPLMPAPHIAKYLHKSLDQVYKRVVELGIRKTMKRETNGH